MTDKTISYIQYCKTSKAKKNLQRRYFKEKLFKYSGLVAICLSLCFLFILLASIAAKSIGAFHAYHVNLSIDLTSEKLNKETIETTNFKYFLRNSLKEKFPEVKKRREKSKLYNFISKDSAIKLKKYVAANPEKIGSNIKIWFKLNSKMDQYLKGNIQYDANKKSNIIKSYEMAWLKQFQGEDAVKSHFNFDFFSNGDSTNPEIAGLGAAIMGSLFTMLIFLLASFPLAVFTALYLEEFAPKNKLTDFIEININNLAAVPSIIFGLLGLALFINMLDVPRSSALVGGFTLSLMVLPTIIIATRNSIKAIPPSIKDAAFGLGASKVQVATHHTLPLAMPGIMTGTILAIARALGETAPLLMIGMIAFIVDIPKNFTDPASALPVQIYLWANNPEIGFIEKTSAAIIILIFFLFLINGLAIYLRNKFNKSW
jgi:phosphate transport system permease protein